MNITGIIAEYNPFHKGHEFHIQESRSKTKADYIIVVMSGNFTQRGEAACVDKFLRARMALLQGADLILELPLPFATASAPDFAKGGVEILNRTGIVTHLSFGSEHGNLDTLKWLASFFEKEPEAFQQLMSAHLKNGLSYPKARAAAFEEYLCCHTNYNEDQKNSLLEILNRPNNILGLSYLRSLQATNSSIEPITITRTGAGYHDLDLDKEFSSASALRKLVKDNGLNEQVVQELQNCIPYPSSSLFIDHLRKLPFIDNDSFSSQLYYYLETLPGLDSVSMELSNRIEKELPDFRKFNEFTMNLKRKNDSYTSIARSLIRLLLHIEETDTSAIPYLRILGFRKDAGPLMHLLKEGATLPIITKPADAKQILDSQALRIFEKELFSEKIYHSAYMNCENFTPYNPYKKTPVIL